MHEGESRIDTSEPGIRGPHDVGGLPAGPIDISEHPIQPWEKRVMALAAILRQHGLLSVDEMRRTIESLGAEEYRRLSYFERWMAAITRILLEKGVLTPDEIGRKLASLQDREIRE